MKKTIRYVFLSVFIFVFAQIYEYFSHGVYSNYMLYAFLIPFLGLAVPSFLLHSLKRALPENSCFLWKCGIATLTVGSIYKGILEIYGTNGYFEFPYLRWRTLYRSNLYDMHKEKSDFARHGLAAFAFYFPYRETRTYRR